MPLTMISLFNGFVFSNSWSITSTPKKQTLIALGLKKLNASREVEATPQILGMINKVTHLVKVEEVA